jgi:hypothetical protein
MFIVRYKNRRQPSPKVQIAKLNHDKRDSQSDAGEPGPEICKGSKVSELIQVFTSAERVELQNTRAKQQSRALFTTSRKSWPNRLASVNPNPERSPAWLALGRTQDVFAQVGLFGSKLRPSI